MFGIESNAQKNRPIQLRLETLEPRQLFAVDVYPTAWNVYPFIPPALENLTVEERLANYVMSYPESVSYLQRSSCQPDPSQGSMQFWPKRLSNTGMARSASQ